VTDPLLAGLRERIERYRETGDGAAVLDNEVELELAALLGPNEGFNPESYYVGGMAHWLRYRAGSTSGRDLTEAARLLALVHDHGRGYEIPGPLRLILECRRAG
jgi:hypothetical protein